MITHPKRSRAINLFVIWSICRSARRKKLETDKTEKATINQKLEFLNVLKFYKPFL